jgi:hypothetical protein
MFKIEYSPIKGKLTVYENKKTVKSCYPGGDINSVAGNFAKSYICNEIRNIANTRINVMNHAVYPDDVVNNKKEKYMRISSEAERYIISGVWLSQYAKLAAGLEELKPSPQSRFHKNYVQRVGDLQELIRGYQESGIFYVVADEQASLDLFDNQAITNPYYL